MLIDSHQHVFWHGRDDAGLVADLDEFGIDFAWLLSWDMPAGEGVAQFRHVLNPAHLANDGTHPGVPLSDLLLTRHRYPDRFVVGYCPDPRIENAPAVFESAVAMHDVRICGEWKLRMLFDDPRCVELFRKAGDLGCPVVLHLDVPFLANGDSGKPRYQPNWYGGTVENLERALRACPDTIFVGHAPGFWREISGDADTATELYPSGPVVPGGRLEPLLDRNANLWADLSAGSALRALSRDPDNANRFLNTYSDRLMFGRDYYGSELLDFLRRIDLAQDVQDRLFHANALRLVDPPGAAREAPGAPKPVVSAISPSPNR